ncbi:MAG: exodeoxyribonuclease VII small subunit [Dehalococcoidia bacterium]|nr:exodeoxyribonuclease VII small subunit [Dehalococcoidia bacterium]
MGEDEERFETLYGALEEKARQLEAGGLPLEESVKLYEEGAAIAAKLRTMLEQTELRITQLDERLAEEGWAVREDAAPYDEESEEGIFDFQDDDAD